jgi:signal transduction histidine kinase
VITAGRRGLIDRAMRRADVLGLVALSLFVGVGLVRRLPEDPGLALAAATTALVAAVMFDRLDARFVLPSAVLGTVAVAALGDGRASYVSWFAVCVFGAWCVLGGRRWDGLAYWAGSLVLFAAEWLVAEEPDPGWAAWMAGTTFTVCAAVLVRHEIGLVNQLREAEAGLAERSRAEERNRIARDLHDVIAHSVSVMVVQAGAAEEVLRRDPERAVEPIRSVQVTGRDAIAELGRLLGILREHGDEVGLAPQPGLDDLGGLLEETRHAGLPVELTVEGDPRRLAPGVELAIYRVVQEALTNARKHAGDARAAVMLRYGAAEVSAEVRDDGSAANNGHGGGHGLIGMRERVAVYGGSLDATHRAEGGFAVRVRIPLDAGE